MSSAPQPTTRQVRNVTTFEVYVPAGWKQSIFLTSDVHFDSVHCRRELLKEHLTKARDAGAWIFDNGDMFDAMQGRYDPRRSYDDIRPEYARQDYYDAIVSDAAKFLQPFADNLRYMGKGNHELSVLKNAGTDMTDRVAARLTRKEDQSHIIIGGYSGYIRIVVKQGAKRRGVLVIHHRHGLGAGAPVTRGTIETNRQQVWAEDTDVIWNGHNHQAYLLPIAVDRMSVGGRIEPAIVWHVRTPGYEDSWHDDVSSWIAQKGVGPKPQGGIWIDMWLQNHELRWNVRPEIRA